MQEISAPAFPRRVTGSTKLTLRTNRPLLSASRTPTHLPPPAREYPQQAMREDTGAKAARGEQLNRVQVLPLALSRTGAKNLTRNCLFILRVLGSLITMRDILSLTRDCPGARSSSPKSSATAREKNSTSALARTPRACRTSNKKTRLHAGKKVLSQAGTRERTRKHRK